jgi:dopachrome tautomerase
LLGSRGPNSQSSAEVFDGLTGAVFYTQINRDAIGCWNSMKPYTKENQGLVASDSENLVFPNDLRIDSEGNLLVLSNRMPIFIYKKLNEEFNYRIFMGKTGEIIKGTPCEN